MRRVDGLRRALRLGFLTGRAIAHVLWTRTRIDAYCMACASKLERTPAGKLHVSVLNAPGARPCPVHKAFMELELAGGLS